MEKLDNVDYNTRNKRNEQKFKEKPHNKRGKYKSNKTTMLIDVHYTTDLKKFQLSYFD